MQRDAGPAFADGATIATRLLAPDPVFDELVFRSLRPVSLGLAIIFTIFVFLGLIDASAGASRGLIVATDAVSAAGFLGLYLATVHGALPRALTYPVAAFAACIPTANARSRST